MAKMEWVADLQGWRCPACLEGLLSRAARHEVLGREDPVHLHSGELACPNGHELPEPDVLRAWNEENPTSKA